MMLLLVFNISNYCPFPVFCGENYLIKNLCVGTPNLTILFNPFRVIIYFNYLFPCTSYRAIHVKSLRDYSCREKNKK